ncbi:hypothetical protein SAMN05421774_107195 [Gemmobacter megaterium]|uniref:Uncharacterized protein n=1 Tax=Gemmobacter megaterium TaxID=1086013 RepID=A0A1N7Q7T5_9RHOB|nr:hypothetical protein [Gemmobacter megaterium]GGE23825.1 hypothetical protein GCM10011345_32240 [Gemmobacter megaterium]SIT18894.1 hypothetical protein SAMN05421774_107195 [Gemmobacter megaterium]
MTKLKLGPIADDSPPDSLYGNDLWVANALGRSLSWWHANRETLYLEGFPKKDPIIGLTPKSMVEKWVANRAAIASNLSMRGTSAVQHTRGKTNAIR